MSSFSVFGYFGLAFGQRTSIRNRRVVMSFTASIKPPSNAPLVLQPLPSFEYTALPVMIPLLRTLLFSSLRRFIYLRAEKLFSTPFVFSLFLVFLPMTSMRTASQTCSSRWSLLPLHAITVKKVLSIACSAISHSIVGWLKMFEQS